MLLRQLLFLVIPAVAAALRQYHILPHFTKPPVLERRVFAVADIHGDYEHTIVLLEKAGVLASGDALKWIAGDATLVQTGDIVDRGPDTRKLFAWIRDLGVVARANGGRVVHLWGNHEFMNAMGDWRYVSAQDLLSFPKPHVASRRIEFTRHGSIGMDFLQNYQLSYLDPIGVYFIHAGLTAEWAKKRYNELGYDFMAYLLEGNRRQDELPAEYAEFYSSNGPLWYRGYSSEPEHVACVEANRSLDAIGASMMVIGHTIQWDHVTTRCNGQILAIDTGLSSAIGGRGCVVELQKFVASDELRILVHYDNETVVLRAGPIEK